ncbi:MAG: DUF5615 family PIN-like protein [Elusimicrobia bacterium]|nr:DUF5615 family PIN-like protein [Elusimicrobiota bacterium]
MPLSMRTVEACRRIGHDVVHAAERGFQRVPDEMLFLTALDERRVLVTMDLGFGRMLSLAGEKGPSVAASGRSRSTASRPCCSASSSCSSRRTAAGSGATTVCAPS